MQINQLSPCDTVESMIRALRTGNYSVVIGSAIRIWTNRAHDKPDRIPFFSRFGQTKMFLFRQFFRLSPCDTVESMIRALRTGNYSVVIGWLPEELTEEEHFRLTEAAEEGNAIGFIMRPVRPDSYRSSGNHPITTL
jgi:cell division inhibitor SulA